MKSIIIYSTKYGFTEKAARALQSKLQGDTTLVNIIKEKTPSLDSFDVVVLGGPIYIGKLQKELKNYIEGNLEVLLKKRIGLFICAGIPDLKERAKELSSAFPYKLYQHAEIKELFGYELNFKKLNFIEKAMMKAVTGNKSSTSDMAEDTIASFANVISM